MVLGHQKGYKRLRFLSRLIACFPLAALIKLTKSKDENVQLKALQICLERG